MIDTVSRVAGKRSHNDATGKPFGLRAFQTQSQATALCGLAVVTQMQAHFHDPGAFEPKVLNKENNAAIRCHDGFDGGEDIVAVAINPEQFKPGEVVEFPNGGTKRPELFETRVCPSKTAVKQAHA